WFAVAPNGHGGFVARLANEASTPCPGVADAGLTCNVGRVDIAALHLDKIRAQDLQDSLAQGPALVKGTIAFGRAVGGPVVDGLTRVLTADQAVTGWTTFALPLDGALPFGAFYRVHHTASGMVATTLNTHDNESIHDVSFEGIECPGCDSTIIASAHNEIGQ